DRGGPSERVESARTRRSVSWSGASQRSVTAGTAVARSSGTRLRAAPAHEFAVQRSAIVEQLVEIVEVLEHVPSVTLGKIGDRANGGVHRVFRAAKPGEDGSQHAVRLAKAAIDALADRLNAELLRRRRVWRVHRSGKVEIVRYREQRFGLGELLEDRDVVALVDGPVRIADQILKYGDHRHVRWVHDRIVEVVHGERVGRDPPAE